ncbi:MAG: hypothetical protein V1748_11130 [Actinomycetota bacterium]
MKECPDCSTSNQDTNLFCPLCGHSFLDELRGPEKSSSPERESARDPHRTTMLVAVVVILLGIAAGVTSYIVSRQIELSRMVTVEAGTEWKCVRCSKVYRTRIARFEVKRAEKEQYAVETIDGTCYTCKYGDQVGKLEYLVETLASKGFFHGFNSELDPQAAAFMEAHPELLPASDQSQVAGMAVEEDPRKIERDFTEFAGRPIHLRCRVAVSETVKSTDGAEATFMQLIPLVNGEEADVELLAIYPGRSPMLRGDEAECWLLPADLIRYTQGNETRKAVLCIVLYMR